MWFQCVFFKLVSHVRSHIALPWARVCNNNVSSAERGRMNPFKSREELPPSQIRNKWWGSFAIRYRNTNQLWKRARIESVKLSVADVVLSRKQWVNDKLQMWPRLQRCCCMLCAIHMIGALFFQTDQSCELTRPFVEAWWSAVQFMWWTAICSEQKLRWMPYLKCRMNDLRDIAIQCIAVKGSLLSCGACGG